jgi:hypothetical protein
MTASAPETWALSACLIATFVDSAPTPITHGPRPATARQASAATASRSSEESRRSSDTIPKTTPSAP